jgi:carbamoyl-phosphate synthase large subunit
MHILDLEKPLGVIVQFGGQTAINLAGPLTKKGIKILGTAVEDLDRAEDRKAFEKALRELHIPQPMGAGATNEAEAIEIATRIGYPVLCRPSYVIGGRAMEIIEDEKILKQYIQHAVSASSEHPVLIDRYLQGKECEVDAICDGETVLIPGIMEHIEGSGIHSGDSMAVYPPQTLSQQNIDTIVDYTHKLAIGLKCIGMMNVQFIIHQDEVVVIEVNPRSSRTVPFLSKVTDIPMAQVATRVILGEKLKDMGYVEGLAPLSKRVHVKAPVFSFAKLRRVDTNLGPEMKSTGEVMGSDNTLDKALYKAFAASGYKLLDHGTVLFTIEDAKKHEAMLLAKRFSEIGYALMATSGTAKYFRENGLTVSEVAKIHADSALNILDLLRKNKISLVVNILSHDRSVSSDGFLIRREAVEHGIPQVTSMDTAKAIVQVLESRSFATQTL